GGVGAERDLQPTFRQPPLLAAIDDLLETGPDGNFTGPDQTAVEFVLPGPPELDVIAHLRRLPRAAADGSLALVVLHDTTALRRAERIRADFVANASHELKTPCAGRRAMTRARASASSASWPTRATACAAWSTIF